MAYWFESRTCNIVSVPVGEWMISTLFQSHYPQLKCPWARHQINPKKPAHCCVCAFGWVKCRPQIPSMENYTYYTSRHFHFNGFSQIMFSCINVKERNAQNHIGVNKQTIWECTRSTTHSILHIVLRYIIIHYNLEVSSVLLWLPLYFLTIQWRSLKS